MNKYFDEGNEKRKKWIIFKKCEKHQKFKSKQEYEYILHYEYNEVIEKHTNVNLYEIIICKDSQDLGLSDSESLGQKYSIENYYPQENENEGLIIYRHQNKYKINSIALNFDLYDYDNISRTLILYRKEDSAQKIGVFINDKKKNKFTNLIHKTSLEINYLNISILNKISLIPCYYGYEKQSLLLFYNNNEVRIMKMDGTLTPTVYNLKEKINFNNFNELKIIVYFDFILILKFDDEKNVWRMKVFSLFIEENKFFELLKEENIPNIDKEAKFSFSEIKEKKYLFALSNKDNNLKIVYWEIISKLSDISIYEQKRENDENSNTGEISIGNCVVNYFYHCFEKYPLIGAVQYNLNVFNKKELKLSFFIEDNFRKKIDGLKNYIKELKKICQNKKKISFDDIDFIFEEEFEKNINIKDSSIGNILIKCLEITPIQIAKIMNNDFKIMSDGENIDKKLDEETKSREKNNENIDFNIEDFSKMTIFV